MSEPDARSAAAARASAVPRHTVFEIAPMLEFAGAPELAGRFGLGSRELDDPDGMIPLPVVHALLEALVEVTGDPYLGLHFGASGNPSQFKRRVGALGLMLLTSPSMAAGMNALARHQNLFNEGDRYALLERGSDTRICFEPWAPERLGQVQMAEKTVAQILVLLSLAEPGIPPRSIDTASNSPSCVDGAVGSTSPDTPAPSGRTGATSASPGSERATRAITSQSSVAPGWPIVTEVHRRDRAPMQRLRAPTFSWRHGWLVHAIIPLQRAYRVSSARPGPSARARRARSGRSSRA